MMLEKSAMERAELYALGMLDEAKTGDFERQLRREPDLQAYVYELEETMAGISLTAPHKAPPAGTFETIMDRIDQRSTPLTRSVSRFGLPVWAAAALVVLSGVSVHQVVVNQQNRKEISTLKKQLVKPANVTVVRPPEIKVTSSGGTERAGELRTLHSQGGLKNYALTQDLEVLKQELGKLKKLQEERFIPQPRMSRMVVVEMVDPALANEEKRERRFELPQKISDIVAAGLDRESGPPEGPVRLSGEADGWDGHIVIEGGMIPLSHIRMPEGSTATHKAFPVENWRDHRGLQRNEDGTFYDRYTDMIWRPLENGDYLGTKAADGEAPTPVQNIETPAIEVPPNAYTLLDETTGEGSIIVSDVPRPEEGQVYQLWINDAFTDSSISLGVVPPLEDGAGRIFFNLPETGISPSNYILTAEPDGGSHTPSGNTILIGP